MTALALVGFTVLMIWRDRHERMARDRRWAPAVEGRAPGDPDATASGVLRIGGTLLNGPGPPL